MKASAPNRIISSPIPSQKSSTISVDQNQKFGDIFTSIEQEMDILRNAFETNKLAAFGSVGDVRQKAFTSIDTKYQELGLKLSNLCKEHFSVFEDGEVEGKNLNREDFQKLSTIMVQKQEEVSELMKSIDGISSEING